MAKLVNAGDCIKRGYLNIMSNPFCFEMVTPYRAAGDNRLEPHVSDVSGILSHTMDAKSIHGYLRI